MSKQNVGAVKRGDLFFYEPERLKIITDRSHPLYDERVEMPLDEGFVRSIAAEGVIEPVVIRKNGELDGAPLIEVVDGRQRVRAACRVNNERRTAGQEPMNVPCKFHVGDAQTAMIATNVHRRDDIDFVLAAKCARYLANGHSIEDTCIAFGRTEKQVEDLLALNSLTPDAKAACKDGSLEKAAALDLAKLPDVEQTKLLKETPAEPEARRKAVRETVRARGSRTRTRERRMRTQSELRDMLARITNARKPDSWKEGAKAAIAWALGQKAEESWPMIMREEA